MPRKSNKIKVTERTRKPRSARYKSVAANLLDNGGDLRKAMNDAGYVKEQGSTVLLKSQNFIELLDEMGVTDTKIATKLAEGLEATKSVVMEKGEYIDLQPDFATRHKYLETLLKVKGHLSADVQKKMNISIKYKPLLAGETTARKVVEGVTLKDEAIEAEVIGETNGLYENDSNRETSEFNQED